MHGRSRHYRYRSSRVRGSWLSAASRVGHQQREASVQYYTRSFFFLFTAVAFWDGFEWATDEDECIGSEGKEDKPLINTT